MKRKLESVERLHSNKKLYFDLLAKVKLIHLLKAKDIYYFTKLGCKANSLVNFYDEMKIAFDKHILLPYTVRLTVNNLTLQSNV